MPLATINNHQLYYEVTGSGEPVLLIIGLGQDHTAWNPLRELLEKKFQVIVYDHYGSGQSDHPTEAITIDDLASDAAALIDELGFKRVHVVGQSMGGATAQTLAAKFSDKVNKLVLLDTFVKFNFVSTLAVQSLIDMQRQQVDLDIILNTIVAWTVSSAYLEQNNNYQKKIETMKSNPHPQPLASFEKHCQALFTFNSKEFLKDIQNDTLVIAAENDLFVMQSEARLLADGILQAELVVVPGGHESHTEQSQLIYEKVENFIK